MSARHQRHYTPRLPLHLFARFACAALAALLALLPTAGQAQEKGPGGCPMVQAAVFNDAKVEQVLASIGNQAGVSITPFGKVPNSRVSILEKDVCLEDALNKLAQPNGWVWFKNEDGSYGVADEAWYKANILPKKVITKIFRPDHVKASELEKAIRPMLTQGISSVTPDDRTNKLIISDLPEVIERIERLIREIDVQLMTRVFYVRNADVNEIAEKIESYKSDPGTIEVDEKTRQIIVTDLLANIKKMELLIDILDVGPEIVIYDVNNIGLEGEDLEELQKIIESIRTPVEDLLFEINEKAGVFILEDVPEVHEKVEQVLASFDQPVKQVLIQGEILTMNFARDTALGVKAVNYSSEAFADPNLLVPGNSGFRNLITPDSSLTNFATETGITGAFLTQQAYIEWKASFDDENTKVLLQPRLLVKNQESSRIFVGSEEPFITTFFNENTTGVSTRSTSQQTVTDGLTFEITPSISNSYLVEMEITIDNDDAERVSVQTSDGVESLIRRDRQSVETVLTIPSGQTRVIGGLISSSSSNRNQGVPFLVNLPVIGHLFGTKSATESRSNLQLFITPSIVEDIIPRPTGNDGRRGRLVTDYHRVYGSYDINADSEILKEGETGVPEDLLAPMTTDDEGAIEDLLREQQPRDGAAATNRDSNFVRRSNATSGAAARIAAENDDRNKLQERDEEKDSPTTQRIPVPRPAETTY
ncbi:MAG: ral secretion pathway protein [Candidatus Sumerlaeota bacterium]|nr:ral secretion pathway protein [Candidatus Sumerlaeota bacterium]